MLDEVTWQLDIYNGVGERLGMHACETREDTISTTTSETFKFQHTLSGKKMKHQTLGRKKKCPG